jgi:23S rRNA pseudouridine955/2504/2580 synthase
LEFIINQDSHDVRLDRFLRKKYQEVALTSIFRLIRKGKIRVNGTKKKQNYRLQAGDTVQVNISTSPTVAKTLIPLSAAEKKNIAQFIAYEDDNIILCNKPPGLVMHCGSGHEYGLVEQVQSFTDNPEFTFVNRIDKATSGLVIGAKNTITSRKLSQLFRQHDIEKYYFIIVEGYISQDTFTLTSFLRKEEECVKEHIDTQKGAKKATSAFTVVQRFAQTTLLEARLFTGRTHQLRVQLANNNHPIVGDAKYGRGGRKNMLLFSHRVVIPAFKLDVSLPVPECFEEHSGVHCS